MNIKDYGWDEYFEHEWKQIYVNNPGLVADKVCCSPMHPGLVADKVCCSPMHPGLVADKVCCSPMHPGLVADKVCCSPMHPGLVADKVCCSPMHPGRIVADYGQKLRVVSQTGEFLINRPLNKTGNALQIKANWLAAGEGIDQPAVGDWVAFEYEQETQSSCIHAVLARKTKFSRAAAGIEVKEQVVAANVDTVFLIQSLNRDFNMRRLERYLIAAWESGAVPVVLLSKADCCDDIAEKLAAVYHTAPGVEVHAISCITGLGLEEIRSYFTKGKTVALLGSSGVGKSTLVNTLAGYELLKTQSVREDDSRGRHTTTHRELVLLPGGGLILDTPGMRTLSLWEADTGMETMFGDVEDLVRQCRFNDCTHGNEPGCAVREALDTDRLELKRWESWLKLQKEIAHLEAKKEGKLRLQEKQWGRLIAKYQKEFYKGRV